MRETERETWKLLQFDCKTWQLLLEHKKKEIGGGGSPSFFLDKDKGEQVRSSFTVLSLHKHEA